MKTFQELREGRVVEATRTALDRKITNNPKKMTQTQRDNEIATSMHDMKKGKKSRDGRPMSPNKAARRAAYRQSQIDRGLRKEGLDENQTKAHLRAKSKLLGGASMMDLERAGNNIRAYAKKSGGIDKKDFETAADYVISLGRLTDANKAGKVLQDLQLHVGMQDTDVRDKIISMLPTGLKKKV